MTIYDRIESLRKSKGLSQRDLEQKLNFSNGSVAKWKNSMPSSARLQKLADYFGTTVEWIMTGKEKGENTIYYYNEETAKLAREMFEDKDMQFLFDLKRNMPPEQFKIHMDFMKKLYGQEDETN